jgi:N-acyl-D-aspartate/D-glutamate deacylase
MISRRDFLLTSGTGVAAAVAHPALLLAQRRRYDVILRGGHVVDGSGRAGFDADVAIDGGRVATVARSLRERGRLELDVRGHVVAPGFIDIHSHGDGSLWQDPRAESVVRQGITTIVVGQDGFSRAPATTDDRTAGTFRSFGDLWVGLRDLRPAVNVASMVGLGAVRAFAVGDANRPATAAELRRMARIVDDALSDGACGASSGLEYTPGAFAPREELVELCRPLARRRLPYATHLRNEDDWLLDAVDEAISVARDAGCPLQISHLKTQGPRNWGKLDDVFSRIAAARNSGQDVTFDRYPYIAYQTGLTNLFPVWSRDGGVRELLARAANVDTADRVRRETLAKIELIGGWDNVMISGVSSVDDKGAEGKRLGSHATSVGRDPYDVTVDLLRRSGGNVGMVGFAMSEQNLERILAHRHAMVCTDGGAFAVEGPARRGHPHPRGLGSFPRVLARYVRERRALSLEQAVRKMSSLPASRVGLRDRGWIARGFAADLVVFDPATIEDRATFADPFQYPAGIKAVIVNGQVALLDNGRSDSRSGRPLQVS